MAFPISQEAFDEIVDENIILLDLTETEAIEETVLQLTINGTDLSKVIRDPGARAAKPILTTLIESLKLNPSIEQLTNLKLQTDINVQYKIQAGRLGAYPTLIKIIDNSQNDVKIAAIKAMVSLLTKNPDLLDKKGADLILANLEPNNDLEIQKFVLRWAKEACIMHEMNRQQLFNLNIVDKLVVLLKEENDSNLREILGLFRVLILDDDVRVEFGKAHEHARVIAGVTLDLITDLLKKFKLDEAVLCDLLLTLAGLLVRAEFCLSVVEAGILSQIEEIMKIHTENEKINRQCFKLLKSLSGHDECKSRIMQANLASLLVQNLAQHKANVHTSATGLQAAASLALRSADNSKVLFEAGLPEIVVEIMQLHPNEKPIQKNASWVVRNMVSRSRYQNKNYLELGVEELLKNNLAKFKELEYDMKAALRDLECDVELKEEWTGKGGRITTGKDSFAQCETEKLSSK